MLFETCDRRSDLCILLCSREYVKMIYNQFCGKYDQRYQYALHSDWEDSGNMSGQCQVTYYYHYYLSLRL